MLRITKLLLLVAVVALVAFGCSQQGDPDITGPANLSLASAALVAGADVQTATLYLFVSTASGNDVSVHRVTSDWDEYAVTFNSFAGAFATPSEASFVADVLGWKTVDVTSLTQGWLAGDYDNFGLLLKHADMVYPRSSFHSREAASQPMLEICYATTGGTECVQIIAEADAYIWASEPNTNHGWSPRLYAGWGNDTDLEKQSLVRFDLPERPELASIGDFVWLDADNDGIQDEGEFGYPNAEVMLYDCADYVATTYTDANGYYLFDELEPGDYNIVFVLPEGYVFSPQDQGADDAVDSDADPSTGIAACTTLDPGEHDPTWDAGLYRPVWVGCSLTIGFWKNHAGFGPQDDVVTDLLPISLGSIDVTTAAEAYAILRQKDCGGPSNGLVKLMAQFLAVKLNGANGADLGAVADEIADADQVLTDYSCSDWDNLSRKQKKAINKLKSTFDDYNNGIIGPGHCDGLGDDD
ncbi:MAG: hypothetical protein DRP45_00770 [Candidatus Zixiibacteriota bacterium]|nr:MAG: hypothetical protein DRP45_00770 [candidate division Zixibacteria bacterium]